MRLGTGNHRNWCTPRLNYIARQLRYLAIFLIVRDKHSKTGGSNFLLRRNISYVLGTTTTLQKNSKRLNIAVSYQTDTKQSSLYFCEKKVFCKQKIYFSFLIPARSMQLNISGLKRNPTYPFTNWYSIDKLLELYLTRDRWQLGKSQPVNT